MLKSNKFNFIHYAALSTLCVGLAIAPANALPGQNIKTVLNWAKTKSQLPTLVYGSEAYGYGDTKGNLHFFVNVPSQNGTVIKEGITASGDSSLKFTNKNAKAVKLVQDIYNSDIAKDFQKSQDVTKVGREQFYRGQKYGYIAAEVQGGTNLQIIPLNNLKEAIKNAKFCQTHQCDV